MKPETLSLLRNPFNREPVRLAAESDSSGRVKEWIVGEDSGQRFPIRNGIPVFVDERVVSGSNRKYQKLYDRIAPWYDVVEKVVGDLKWGGRDKVRREIVRPIDIAQGNDVLEVSIGTGINLRYLPHHANYYGLDLSLGMLKRCQRNLAKWKLQAELVQGLAESLPFRDAVFDAVFHFGGINYFNDKASAIREMIRVAKPGARICIGDEAEALSSEYERSHMPFVNRLYSAKESFAPTDLIPGEMEEVGVQLLSEGKFYMIGFRRP